MDPALLMEDDAVVADDKSPELLSLQRDYTFWIFIKSSNRAADDWKPKPIANFRTVQDFWSIYQHLKRPNQLEAGTMINLVSKTINQLFCLSLLKEFNQLGRMSRMPMVADGK